MPILSNRFATRVVIFMVRDNSSPSNEIYLICLSSAQEDIPQSIIQLDGAAEQLKVSRKSDVVTEIIAIAAGFQETASDNRLGRPRTQNPGLQKATLARFKKPAPGLSKGKTLMAEMKAAATDGHTGRIKITAGLYLLSKYKRGPEVMKKVMSLYYPMSVKRL
jgi:hypothetical protein